MDWLLAGFGALTALLGWRFLVVRKKLVESEGARAEIEGEEHRMFDFLHLLGEAIEDERSLEHLYRTIVEGMEEVLGADGGGLFLTEGEDFAPGYLSEECPAVVAVPAEVKDGAVTGWMRLARVKREGELLEELCQDGKGRWWKQGEEGLPKGVSEMMAVPLWHGGRVFGVLVVTLRSGVFSANDWDVFRSGAEQSGFGLGNALLHREVHEKRKLEDELRTAREVQRVLLPEENPDWPGYRVRGTNVPARLISGDYFDFVDLPEGQHGVVVADVSGKGVGAGLVMASCRSALRAVVTKAAGPVEAMVSVNEQLFPDIREDMFVSAAYAVFENGSGRVRLARAGHDAPLLFRKETGEVEVVKPGGLALGIDEGPVFERVTKEALVEMKSGDVFLFYTDGVNEAENGRGEEYGKERLRERFAELAKRGAEGVVEGLPRDVKVFADGHSQLDDVTVVAVERV
ncbi:MAG: GAF domain-containing SpoIIE family protein phosphatase [Verrucomicrobiota bacterium]